MEVSRSQVLLILFACASVGVVSLLSLVSGGRLDSSRHLAAEPKKAMDQRFRASTVGSGDDGTESSDGAESSTQTDSQHKLGVEGAAEIHEPDVLKSAADIPDSSNSGSGATPADVSEQCIWVHVTGAVKNPGVYSLPKNARAFEGLEAAGGKTPEAAVDYLNLAEILEDGSKLHVPTMSEIRSAEKNSVTDLHKSTGQVAGKSNTASKININQATASTLEALPGIGPSLASRIVEYRKAHGQFRRLEDLMNVKGIGEKTLEKIKPYITI